MLKEINASEANFQQEVLDSPVPVLVDFWAAWCGPCSIVAPILDAVALEMAGKVKVVKVNVDENNALAIKYAIQAIPTLLLFKNGEVVKTLVGVHQKAEILQLLQ
ncbi:MAG: thioredoxin [Oscillospiraceae bacterium]|nr:thioredoxin [Oscillospiraceae bacterium]